LCSVQSPQTTGSARGSRYERARRPGLLAFGVAANLLLLGICKYRPFAIENLNMLFGLHWPVPAQVLPLGVSFFFTFTQIAFLVDAHRGAAQLYPGLRYGLFVLFFRT
jgi:D-alanyl-lipoteichoic acid acyltransferase DltB (MBOAT superfamily)